MDVCCLHCAQAVPREVTGFHGNLTLRVSAGAHVCTRVCTSACVTSQLCLIHIPPEMGWPFGEHQVLKS